MQTLAAAFADPPVQADMEAMEAAFSQDFKAVRLVAEPHCAGQLGSSRGEEVHLAPQLSGLRRRMVLAHELAHVVQRRNAARGTGRPAGGLALEREAHGAALAAARGGAVRCVLADPADTPRAWGVAGHYYTAYFVMMAAGLDNRTAFQMAFYAQMPDQVDELDATSAGIDIYSRSAFPGALGDPGALGGPSPDSMRAMARDYDVQMGLHCLTGGPSEDETRRRRGVLEAAGIGSFEFGLAIHPFGDSFAHRVLDNPGRMYAPFAGHSVEFVRGRDAHSPDFLNRRPDLYRAYGEALYDIVSTKAPRGGQLLSRDAVGTRLLDVARVQGDGNQISAMRQFASIDLCQIVQPYQPEAEDLVPWSTFRGRHPELLDQLLPNALTFAKRWSRPS